MATMLAKGERGIMILDSVNPRDGIVEVGNLFLSVRKHPSLPGHIIASRLATSIQIAPPGKTHIGLHVAETQARTVMQPGSKNEESGWIAFYVEEGKK